MLAFALASSFLALLSFNEAASQLPNGKASPVQLPVLTTPVTIQLSREAREELVRDDVSSSQLSRLTRVAIRRLANEPLDAEALWLWSFSQDAQIRKRTLHLAERMSLRETPVQLQLMKLEAEAGDLSASLNHLDNALLVSDSAAPAMLRALLNGLDQPGFVKLLRPYIDRPWYKLLLQQAVLHATDPRHASELLLQAPLSSDDLPNQLITTLATRLVMASDYMAAKAVVMRFVGLRESTFSDFSVSTETTVLDAAPLTWTFSGDANLKTKSIANGVLFDFERGFGGPLMTRITSFSAGNYTLRQAIEASTSDLILRWELQCLDGGKFKTIWYQSIPVETRQRVYDINISIGPKCLVQRWQLVTLNETTESRTTLAVRKMRLLNY
jgi:hypothetical protein